MADTTKKQIKVSLRHIGRLGDHLFLGSYLFDSRDLQLNVPTIMSSCMTDPGFHHLGLLQNNCKPLFISKYTNELIFQPLLPPPWQLLGANTATTGKKLVLLKSPELNLAFVSSVRSPNSHPHLLVNHHHHPLFQITPVLNTGLSLTEPLQLYKVNRCLARYSPRATTTNRPTTGH